MKGTPLEGRVALVTGASRGIGYASALGLARAGAHVIATARTQGGLEALDDEIRREGSGGATLVPLDLQDGAALDQLGRAIYDRWGLLDVLVSAAGELGLITPLAHLEPRTWDRALAVNLTANYRLIRSLDPLFRRAAAARAIFLTSGAAAEARAFWGPYAVTKAALEMMVRTYADETAHTAVRCALLNPGPMRTRMRAAAFPGEDPDTLPGPEALAPLVVELARPDLIPPTEVVRFRDWAAASH
jgi:NAD(P)-dependent dehydrogenase (short-subunit alcohol dehydrogenase family)